MVRTFIGILFVLLVLLICGLTRLYLAGHLCEDSYIETLRVVVIGFVVSGVVALVPYALSEAKYRFERKKEAKKAYSLAKTSVMYLPERVATRGSYAEALNEVRRAHQRLHNAETYPAELAEFLYGWYNIPSLWTEEYYWKIQEVRKAIGERIEGWDQRDAAALRDQMKEEMKHVADYYEAKIQEYQRSGILRHRKARLDRDNREARFKVLRSASTTETE